MSKKPSKLEEFFRNSDLGGKGGELPELLADTIDGIRTGKYVFRIVETLHPLSLDVRRLEKLKLTAELAVEYISDPEFPEYVARACQEMSLSSCHHPVFIYKALETLVKEKRGAKYGRNLAMWINWTIDKLPKHIREDYKKEFLDEVKTYSFTPRKQGTPRNEGCVFELEGIISVNIENPNHLARLVKEILHERFSKTASQSIMKAILANL